MTRRLPALLFDLSLAVIGYSAAWTLRFGPELSLFVPFARRALPIFVLAQIAGALATGGYRRLSATTVKRFAIGAALGALVGVGLAHLRFGSTGLSHASLAGAAIFFVVAGAGWRALGAIALRHRSGRSASTPPPGMTSRTGPAPLGLGLASLYHYRGLLRALVAKDLKLKYRGSVLGVAWSLLNPLALVGVYSIAFQYIMPQKQEHFVFSLLVGLLAWTFFASSASMSTGAIVDSGSLLKSVRFPRAILPVSVVLFNFAQYLLTLTVFLPVMFVWYDIRPSAALLGLPLVLGLLVVFSTGVALAVSAATARFRDVRHLLDISLSLLFWLTPIVYTAAQLPDGLRLPVMLNPLSSFITASREIILHGAWPGTSLWIVSAFYAGAAMAIGTAIFLTVEDQLAEQV